MLDTRSWAILAVCLLFRRLLCAAVTTILARSCVEEAEVLPPADDVDERWLVALVLIIILLLLNCYNTKVMRSLCGRGRAWPAVMLKLDEFTEGFLCCQRANTAVLDRT